MEALRRLARSRGVSMASLVREAVDGLLSSSPPNTRARALSAAGRFASGECEGSEQHDKLLAEMFDHR